MNRMCNFISNLVETIVPTQSQSHDTQQIMIDDKNNNNNVDDEDVDDDNNNILSISFNQDNSCISVATLDGFRIYQCKPFTKAFECNNNNISCRFVSMLFATSLVALIGGGINIKIKEMNNNKNQSSLRNVKLYNTKNKQELCRLNFKSTVLNVKMNKSRLVICVENKIHIFDLINNMKQIYEIITYINPYGIFDLCCDDDNNLLSYLDKSKQGSIGILDAYNLQKRTIFQAHDNSLQNMQFNADGNYLCSTSIMGTLIRIFAIPSGTHIYTFRRGTYPSKIYSISFNPSSTLLSITSQRKQNINITNIHNIKYIDNKYPSIHIFDLNKYKYNQSKKISSSQSINQLNNKINEYLPQSFKNQIEHPRSIITINIKIKTKYLICGWLNDYSLLCATKNGYFYRYSINDNDNSYKLLSEHTLKDNDYDLHKQQKTKIYKTTTTKQQNHNEEEQELEQEQEKEQEKEQKEDQEEEKEDIVNDTKDNDDKQNKKDLIIDDLFDLSDAEYDATNGNTPGQL